MYQPLRRNAISASLNKSNAPGPMLSPIAAAANRCLTLNGRFAMLLSQCEAGAALQKQEGTMSGSLRFAMIGALVLAAGAYAGTAAAKLGSCNDPIVLGTTLSE